MIFLLIVEDIGFKHQHFCVSLTTASPHLVYWTLQVVTCGNLPLESSFQRVPRCVYTSTCLYEYRGWDSKAANTTHHRFTWGLRSMEVSLVEIQACHGRMPDSCNAALFTLIISHVCFLPVQYWQRHAVDFYISDFQSGLRALVRTGSGARVTPYVDESVVIDINPDNKDMSPEFLRWLRGRNLSSDDRIMRLKEGYSFFLHLLSPRHSLFCDNYQFHLTRPLGAADISRRAALWVWWVLSKGMRTCWWSFLQLNPSPLAANGPSASSRPASRAWSWDAKTHLTWMWYQSS